MLRWLHHIFTPKPRRPTERPADPAASPRVEQFLRSPGRADRLALISLAHSVSQEDFVAMVHCPSLVGSAIRDGELSKSKVRSQDSSTSHDVLTNATFQFSPADVSAFLEGGSIEQTIFLLRKEPDRTDPNPAHRFTIGRAKSNDIRIVDFAISRSHAVIEFVSGSYLIQDCRSRNGTRINGRPVRVTPERLSDGDIISLGRYEFSFLLPGSLYERLRGFEISS
jgi:hypothetical protein